MQPDDPVSPKKRKRHTVTGEEKTAGKLTEARRQNFRGRERPIGTEEGKKKPWKGGTVPRERGGGRKFERLRKKKQPPKHKKTIKKKK